MKKILRKTVHLFYLAIAAVPYFVMAQTGGPKSVSEVWILLNDLFNILFLGIMFVAVVYIIIAAYNYLSASGDPKKVDKANHMLLYAVIGVIVAVLAKNIPRIAADIVGINLDSVIGEYTR